MVKACSCWLVILLGSNGAEMDVDLERSVDANTDSDVSSLV